MNKIIKNIFSQWDHFWFKTQAFEQLGLFRLITGSLIFIMYSFRAMDYEYLFSESGILPLAKLDELLPAELHYVFPLKQIFIEWNLGPILYGVMLLLLFLMAIGLSNRLLSIILFTIHLTFLQKNFLSVYGVDMLTTFILLYNCFVDSYRNYSLKSLLFKSTKAASELNILFSSLAYRLLQIQICIVYAYAGIEKAKGGSWWSGNALWIALNNGDHHGIDVAYFANFPVLLVLLTFMTLFFEIYFPFLILNKKIRIFAMIFGVGMHLGIILTMNLWFFSFIMVSFYILFLSKEQINSLWKLKHQLNVLNFRSK